ncbi:MAG: hypothetical protein R3C68_03200 [Myxococcota bacterium]
MHEGEVSTRLGLNGIPRAAEDVAVFRDISLAEYTGRPSIFATLGQRPPWNVFARQEPGG